MFGTPVFKTMGGQSKCPGETATQRRESGVKIRMIVPRCGATGNSTCDADTLNIDSTAAFGLVVENLSPTEEDVYFTAKLFTSWDFYATDFRGQCGEPGKVSGLELTFPLGTDMRIPYKTWVEIPFYVTYNGLCKNYKGIPIQLVATCEQNTSSSEVYQYGIKYGEISYDSKDLLRGSQSFSEFSVEWPGNQRRLSEDNELPAQTNVMALMYEENRSLNNMMFLYFGTIFVLALVLQIAFAVWVRNALVKLESKL